MPTIKKISGNEYCLSQGYWVRNPHKKSHPIDINNLLDKKDFRKCTENEQLIKTLKVPSIGIESFAQQPNCLIVSDGYKFNEKQDFLKNLPNNVCVIGINRSLAKLKIDDKNTPIRKMNYYIVNNPYKQCLAYLPKHNYRPTCIASIRNNYDFLKKYKGNTFYYEPTPTKDFGNQSNNKSIMDDYRNPVCAALSWALKLKAKKICLFCCDDVFEDERPSSIQIPNGMYMYPQHKIAHNLIDGFLYWLGCDEDNLIEVVNYSQGIQYNNTKYIEGEDLKEFYEG